MLVDAIGLPTDYEGYLKGRWFEEVEHPTVQDAILYKMKEGKVMGICLIMYGILTTVMYSLCLLKGSQKSQPE